MKPIFFNYEEMYIQEVLFCQKLLSHLYIDWKIVFEGVRYVFEYNINYNDRDSCQSHLINLLDFREMQGMQTEEQYLQI